MKSIKRFFSLYWPFASNSMQSALAYKLNFLMFTFGGIIWAFVPYYLWKAIFNSSSSPVIQGFTFGQMSQYVFVSYVVTQFTRTMVSVKVADEVKSGAIAMNLIKPINYRLLQFFDSLGQILIKGITVAVPLLLGLALIRAASGLSAAPPVGTYLIFIASMLMSIGISFQLDFMFGLLAFYVTNIWGMNFLKTGIFMLVSGRVIPLAFFPAWLGTLFGALPFASINYTPVMIYLGKLQGRELLIALGLQVFWVLAMWLLSELSWASATRRLTILGG